MIQEALLLTLNADEGAVLRLVSQRAGLVPRLFTDPTALTVTARQETARAILLAYPRREALLPLVRQLSEESEALLIVIGDPLPENDWAALLDAGADLVICRPFSSRLLIAQLRALLRRTSTIPVHALPVLAVEGISLDPANYTVTTEEQGTHRLTQLEFRLLYVLMNHAGQTLSVEQIIEHVWGFGGRGSRDLVRGLIKRLRSKIETNPNQPQRILTVRGVGYRFYRSM
ncbi:DNA-binding response regulator [Candidatus Parcubacteria bacterium]|nr:MAG: DNA-binding response regulator [Candidatus Parcubacteria bacterium]